MTSLQWQSDKANHTCENMLQVVLFSTAFPLVLVQGRNFVLVLV